MAASIDSSTKGGSLMVQFMSSGNFITSLLLGGSMQQLWGLIRAMQFLILGFLIRVPLPGHAFKFFEGCAQVAQLDIFDGAALYDEWFTVIETEPLNFNFDIFDIGSKNFLFNSGSFFIFFIGIIGVNFAKFIVSMLARGCARYNFGRQIGMKFWSRTKVLNVTS